MDFMWNKSRNEISATLFFIGGYMARGVVWRMNDFQATSTQIKYISISLQDNHLPLERPEFFDVEFRGRFFGKEILHQPFSNFFGVAFGTIFNPIALQNMREKSFEQMGTSGVIPVSVSYHHMYR